MKCEKCGNDYNSQYYFAVPGICKDCFEKMPADEQQLHLNAAAHLIAVTPYEMRIGFGRRFVALLIDIIIVTIIMIIFQKMSGYSDSVKIFMENSKALSNDPQAINELMKQFFVDNLGIFLFQIIFGLIYYSLEIFIGSTLGKLIMGIQIGNADMTTAPISRLAYRYILKNIFELFIILFLVTFSLIFIFISLLISLAFVVGCFFAFSEKRQALHDILAKTAVFYRNELNSDYEQQQFVR